MRYGKDADALEAMAASGRHVPAIDSRPEVLAWGWLWEAYLDLSTCRSIGMAVGPIPWTAIHLYGQGLGVHDRWMLGEVIRHLDSLWRKESERDTAKTGSQFANARPPRGSR